MVPPRPADRYGLLRSGHRFRSEPPPGHDRLLEIEMPEHFVLQVHPKGGRWIEEAVCLARHFTRLPDRSYCGAAGGWSPTWFRCVEHHDGYFVHVDGGGRRFRYRLLPIPLDGVIELPEGGKLYPQHPPEPRRSA